MDIFFIILIIFGIIASFILLTWNLILGYKCIISSNGNSALLTLGILGVLGIFPAGIVGYICFLKQTKEKVVPTFIAGQKIEDIYQDSEKFDKLAKANKQQSDEIWNRINNYIVSCLIEIKNNKIFNLNDYIDKIIELKNQYFSITKNDYLLFDFDFIKIKILKEASDKDIRKMITNAKF